MPITGETYSDFNTFKNWVENYGKMRKVKDLKNLTASINMFSAMYDVVKRADGWECGEVNFTHNDKDSNWFYTVTYKKKAVGEQYDNSEMILVTVNETGKITEEAQYEKLQQFSNVQDFRYAVSNRCTGCPQIDEYEDVGQRLLAFVWTAIHFEELFGAKCDGVELSYVGNKKDSKWCAEFTYKDNSLFYDCKGDIETIRDFAHKRLK